MGSLETDNLCTSKINLSKTDMDDGVVSIDYLFLCCVLTNWLGVIQQFAVHVHGR